MPASFSPPNCYPSFDGDVGGTPGPAQRIMEGTRSVRMSSLNTPFSPTRSSCPTNASRLLGLILSANGMASSAAFRFTFLTGGGPSGRVSVEGSGVGGWTCIFGDARCAGPRFLEWLEKKPVRKEDWS